MSLEPELAHVHRHLTYRAVSVVRAVACPECGIFVAGEFTGEHNRWHDFLDRLAAAVGVEQLALAPGSGSGGSEAAELTDA